MAEFACRVATPGGEVFERSYEAEDEVALRRELEGQDLMILDLRRRNSLLSGAARVFRFRGAVSARDFLLFNQQFCALLRAGLPIMTSLDILLERGAKNAFHQALLDIRDRVKAGEALSEAFANQGDMFPNLYSASLASGERSGELSTVLQRYIEYSQKALLIKSKVVSALIYPAILLTLALVLICVMVFYIIPQFSIFLASFNQELPLVTKAIMGVANFCRDHWQIIAAVAAALVVGTLAWNRTDAGRLFFARFSMRLPLVGKVIDNYAQNRFTRTLGTLQAGGIPLVTSLELSSRAVGNLLMERTLLRVMEQVREGRTLWESLDDTGMISDITIQMVKVGESTGDLESMLHHASDFTDHEIDTRLTRLVTLVEPLMLVFMAVVVGTMLMSIYLPMFQLYGSSGGGGF